jgi:hypothetical protein
MWKKLFDARIWRRIYVERLGEPIVYNVVSIFVLVFGNILSKIKYDCVPRQPYAFGVGEGFRIASEQHRSLGIKRVVLIEFGVASGAGLLNMCSIARRLSEHYALPFQAIGFDTGEGMPLPVDYRDHPEKYLDGDFVPHDTKRIEASLPGNARIVYGSIADSVGSIDELLEPGDWIAFVSVDVDYWSSTVDCLKIFQNQKLKFLPMTPVYFDDVNNIDHHEFAGELLAIKEFNARSTDQKISRMNQIRNWRIFKNALYLDQMYWFFDFSSRFFTRDYHSERKRVQLSNPYLDFESKNYDSRV